MNDDKIYTVLCDIAEQLKSFTTAVAALQSKKYTVVSVKHFQGKDYGVLLGFVTDRRTTYPCAVIQLYGGRLDVVPITEVCVLSDMETANKAINFHQ